jgi:hypothetical protein
VLLARRCVVAIWSGSPAVLVSVRSLREGREQRVALRLWDLVPYRRADHSWADRVDPDRGQLDGQSSRQALAQCPLPGRLAGGVNQVI